MDKDNLLAYISSIILAVCITLLFVRGAEAQTVTTSTAEDGRILYTGPNLVEAVVRCQAWVNINPERHCTWKQVGVANGIPFTKTWRMFVASSTGVWTWIAPTELKDGRILTDLSHYLLWRQPPGSSASPWAQIQAGVERAVFPMGPEFYNSCFWVTAIRKPNTSTPDPSDKSNIICMDERGQPLPKT